MPIHSELLEILCDPETKAPIKELSKDLLAKFNAAVESGNVRDVAGTLVEEVLEEGLITDDGKTVYRIDGGIPIMLSEMGISTAQIPGF